MSERIVNDPSLHGWEQDGATANGTPIYKWAEGADNEHPIVDGDTEGQVTTWDGAKWTPDSSLIIDSAGDATFAGTVNAGDVQLKNGTTGNNQRFRAINMQTDNVAGACYIEFLRGNSSSAGNLIFGTPAGDALTLTNGGDATFSGNVGIGMTPLRSTAKEQLAEWKASFDARLKAEPKADKKAVTLEITDDAFEVLPTEEALAEWMETRAAGDKLQVDGNISATGTVNGLNLKTAGVYRDGFSGIWFADNNLVGMSGDGSSTDGDISLGNASNKFKDAHFSGTVNAESLDSTNWRSSTHGVQLNLTNSMLYPMTADNADFHDGKISLGRSGAYFKDGYFRGTVAANSFWGDGSNLTRRGSPLVCARDLIETLSTLRNATKDETTLEGLRDAIGDAVGGLIQKFEAEMAAMPAPEEEQDD